MFSSFAKPVSKSVRRSSIEIPRTTEFVRCVSEAGMRLSYAALAQAAKELGENESRQILAQRGSALTKALPEALQPHVCRKAGGYAKGIEWNVETPSDLVTRPVIILEDAAGAVSEWVASLEG